MAIAKLSIDLEARLAGLQAGLDKAAFLTERSAARMDAAFSKLRSFGQGLFGAIGVRELVRMADAVLDGIDNLNDLSDATGDTVENLSALEDVALRTGTSMDTASDAIVKLNKALDEARKDKDSAAGQAVRNLGLEVTELFKLSPVERLQAVGKALNSFDGENKLFYNLTLLGKGTRELAPLLKDLGEAGKLVATVTTQEAAEAEKFNKELFAMEKNVLDASRALAGPMISSLNETIEKFRAGAKEGKSFYRVIFEEQLKLLGLGPDAPAPALDSKAGAGRGFINPDFVRPSLPAIAANGSGDNGARAAKRAADERLRLAEFSARQLVEIEEQAAHDTADAWKAWERQQLDISKQRADAEKEQWRQVFEFIDQQQAEAIEQGQAVLDAAQKSTDGLAVFAEQAARNIQDALGNTLEATLSGNFDSIGAMWKNLLIRMASEAAAARIAKELFGDFGGAGGGSIGGSIGSLLALLPKFASGTDYVPRDMIAMVHRGERIVPAAENARGASSGAPALTYAPVIQIDSRTDQAQVAQLVAAGVQQGQRQMLAHLKASGVLA